MKNCTMERMGSEETRESIGDALRPKNESKRRGKVALEEPEKENDERGGTLKSSCTQETKIRCREASPVKRSQEASDRESRRKRRKTKEAEDEIIINVVDIDGDDTDDSDEGIGDSTFSELSGRNLNIFS